MKTSSARLILENDHGLKIGVFVRFKFTTPNNQAEYAACLVGLRMEYEIRVEEVIIKLD